MPSATVPIATVANHLSRPIRRTASRRSCASTTACCLAASAITEAIAPRKTTTLRTALAFRRWRHQVLHAEIGHEIPVVLDVVRHVAEERLHTRDLIVARL